MCLKPKMLWFVFGLMLGAPWLRPIWRRAGKAKRD